MKLQGQGSGKHSAAKPARADRTQREKPVRERPQREKKEKNISGGRKAAAVFAIIAAFIVLGCAGGVAYVSTVKTVYPNVKLDGFDVGGMTDIELSALLVGKNYEAAGDQTVTVKLPLGTEISVSASDVCSGSSVSGIVDEVMDYCHGKSALSNALTYLRCRFSGAELESGSETTVDRDAVHAAIDSAVREVNMRLVSSQVTIGEDTLTVIKGASGMSVDGDEVCDLIVKAFEEKSFEPIVYEPRVSSSEDIDLDELYDKVVCEAENASYDPETDTITDEVCGLSFDMATARKIWNSAAVGDAVEIPLTVEEPEVTAESLRELLFRDQLCKKPTTLVGSSSNRINNVTKAAASINGHVVMPGEEFSYNDVLGERTKENGYLPAGAYSGGQTVQEYGGGICQVSSALYYCALYSNLKITARTCHMFPVGYVPAGMDATVSWGGPEFKFVNDREYPIKIVSYVEDKDAVVEIWGTDTDGSYVEMTSNTSLVYDSKYTDVAIGYRATTYRKVFDKDGNLLSDALEAKSVYNYHKEDIKWPEESPEPTPTPEVTPTPEPEPVPTPEFPSETPVPAPTPGQEFPDPPFWDENTADE